MASTLDHPGCTRDRLPIERWDEDDEVCKIRKFYGPKRAIPQQDRGPVVYTFESCHACGWSYWCSPNQVGRVCKACYRDKYWRPRVCRECRLPFVGRWARCLACQAACRACIDCGGALSPHRGAMRCTPCHNKTLDPVKLKAQRRRSSNARRARKLAAQVAGPVPMRVYLAVVESGPCVYCEAEADTVDHVQPLAGGGHEAEYNLVPACNSCNSSKCATPLTRWDPVRVRHAIEASPKVAAVWAALLNGEYAQC